jgi:hypothetical protein
MALLRWTGLFAVTWLWAFACGGESRTDGASGGASTGGASGSGGSAGSAGQSGGSAGLSLPDAAKDVATDPGLLSDAGWFDCKGCLCPGDTHYCLSISAGMVGPPPPPDAATCAEKDSGTNHCVPLPSGCGGVPSCACVDQGFCSCDDVGGGLSVHCAYP